MVTFIWGRFLWRVLDGLKTTAVEFYIVSGLLILKIVSNYHVDTLADIIQALDAQIAI